MERGTSPLRVRTVVAVLGLAAAATAAEQPRTERRADALTVRSTVVRAVPADGRRRAPDMRGASPRAVEGLGDGNSWFVVESADADFGEMLPGVVREVPGAFILRVHSDRDWELRLLPTGDLEVTSTVDRVPLDRLAWRGPASGGYERITSTAPITVARGGPTGGAGQVVAIDLRLELSDRDTLGRYAVGFRAVLEAR